MCILDDLILTAKGIFFNMLPFVQIKESRNIALSNQTGQNNELFMFSHCNVQYTHVYTVHPTIFTGYVTPRSQIAVFSLHSWQSCSSRPLQERFISKKPSSLDCSRLCTSVLMISINIFSRNQFTPGEPLMRFKLWKTLKNYL